MSRGTGNQLFRRAVAHHEFDVVTTADLPLTRRESAYDSIVRYVHSLPSRAGIRLKNRAPKPDAEGKAAAIKAWAKRIGMPVTTQIRHAGGKRGSGQGYQIWVFKRRDWITKRNGHAVAKL